MFRHELISYFAIIKKEHLEKLNLKFNCEEDPMTKKPVNIDFSVSQF